MASKNHLGNRNSRTSKIRTPSLGYYLIVTDTKETEKNYFIGLRDSLPQDVKDKIVIKVIKTETNNLIEKARELSTKESQFQQIWIVFDRDLVVDFDSIIDNAKDRGMSVGWSNPCFEIWLHAYLGSMPNYPSSVKCVEGFSKAYEKVFKKEYCKNSETIYKDLNAVGSEEKAIELAYSKFEQASKQTCAPSKMCPATTVQLLVNEIKIKTNK